MLRTKVVGEDGLGPLLLFLSTLWLKVDGNDMSHVLFSTYNNQFSLLPAALESYRVYYLFMSRYHEGNALVLAHVVGGNSVDPHQR